MDYLKGFISKLSEHSSYTPHANNLRHKILLSIKDGKFESRKGIFKEIELIYSKVLAHHFDISDTLENWTKKQLQLVNEYLRLLAEPKFKIYSHQSDFKSSIIPELVCVIFGQIVKRNNLPLIVNGQNDIIIDLLFSHCDGGNVFPTNKRVDASLLVPYPLEFKASGTSLDNFSIPIIAVEVKTNLDKNMISGIIHSVEKLKSTFPECKYYVLSEFSDFNTKDQNYANSSIDEIYLLRKQKRSEFRSKKIANEISAELVLEFVNSVDKSVKGLSKQIETMNKKLTSGLLIGKISQL
jgi:hypothetical protein